MKVKIVTFVPTGSAVAVRQAMGAAGAGSIGNYSFCSFSVAGAGRFMPSAQAKPHIGQANQLEAVTEERIEVVCERAAAKQVIAAVRAAHPYEEAAIDIYPLLAEDEL
jgi:hypothetical protein